MRLTSLHILPCSPVCFVKSFLPSILDAISFASSGLNEQQYHFKVKCLIGLTIKSDRDQLLSVVLVYLRMRQIPHALGRRACIYWCDRKKKHCVLGIQQFFNPPQHLLSTIYKCDGCLSSREHGVLPAIGAVYILELAANSRSQRMFQASNLHNYYSDPVVITLENILSIISSLFSQARTLLLTKIQS